MTVNQEVEYLRAIVHSFPQELKEPVAKALMMLNEAGFVIINEMEFNELHSAWLRLPGILQQMEMAKSGITGPVEGVVRKK